MERLEYITQKALIKCSNGAAPGLFTPTYNTSVKINGCLVATAMDKVPMVNIPTFVICAVTQQVCAPSVTMWQDTYPVKVKGQPTLLGKSCMQCGVGGKIEFLTSGQIPLSAEEEKEVEDMREDVQKAHEEELKEANKPWGQKAGEFVLDMIPVVGPLISLASNVSEGNFGMAVLDVGFLALDVGGLVATPFTGGLSLAATTAAKAGLRATAKVAIKSAAKKVGKESIKAGMKQTGELLSKLTVKNLTNGKLCVFACFPAGTPVAVKDAYRNIEDIQVGDEVWAWDEASGEVALKRIISTLQREVHALVELSIEGETIYSTPEHPFFVDGEWKEAGLLEVIDQVQLFSSKNATVESVQIKGAFSDADLLQVNDRYEVLDIGSAEDVGNTKVYNLEVEGFSTYFVGWLKALVHNSGVCIKAIIKRLPKTKGQWVGEAGESIWKSSKKAVNKITNGEGIPFKNGFPDFSKWSKGKFTFKNLDGTAKDFDKVYERVAKNKGLKNKTEAKKYLKDKGLTPHHHQDGKTIELIPTELHGNVPHSGGASLLRNGNI